MTRYLSGTHRLGAEDIAASQMIDDDLVPVFVDQIFFQHAGEQNAGAAGGMGGGLLPFLNAELQSGIEVILKTLRFEEVVRQADLILTGEGKLDRQTVMGKALDGILRVGEKCQVPVIAFGGAVEATEALNRMGFTAVLPIQPFPVTLEEAMQPEFTKENIERTVRQVVRIIKQFTK